MKIPRARKGLKHSQTKYSFMAANITTKNSVLPTAVLENILSYSCSTTGEVVFGLQEILGSFGAHHKEAFPSLSLLSQHQQGTVQDLAQHLGQQGINENSGREQNSIYCLHNVTLLLSNFPGLASKPSTPGPLHLFQHLPLAQHDLYPWQYTSPHNCLCSSRISSKCQALTTPPGSLPQLLRPHWSPRLSIPWLVPST